MATSKPQQYANGIDTIKRAEANMTVDECIACAKFNLDKYTWREKGQDLDDAKKAVFYSNWLLRLELKKAKLQQ